MKEMLMEFAVSAGMTALFTIPLTVWIAGGFKAMMAEVFDIEFVEPALATTADYFAVYGEAADA